MVKVDLTEQQWEMQLHAAHRAGASQEREAIVDWLREAQGSIRWPDEDGIRITRCDGNEFADRIESAAHLRGDDE